MVRGILLLGASSFSAAVGCLGCTLLAYALGTHLLAPGAASTSRDLYFDLTQPAPVATASFLQQDLNSLRALSKTVAKDLRFRRAGNKMAIALQLEMEEAESGPFQVTAQLLSADGRSAATVSKPWVTRRRGWISQYIRMLMYLPLYTLGMANPDTDIWVPLFDDYQEQSDIPFAVFQATLQGRAGELRVPLFYKARVHVTLRMGFIRRCLYGIRTLSSSVVQPFTGLSLVAFLLGLPMFLSGSGGAILFAYLWSMLDVQPGAPEVPESSTDAEIMHMMGSRHGHQSMPRRRHKRAESEMSEPDSESHDDGLRSDDDVGADLPSARKSAVSSRA
ncbi:hypothetical protein WJX74_008496 [Apatococcus lobatus]|uniref:Seipin n=2 Tax=Apatococcus TaxID=904362 RepID=A0AAW1SYH8_9CHLO